MKSVDTSQVGRQRVEVTGMTLNKNETYILQSIFSLFFHELGPNILFILNIRITADRMFLLFRYIIILLNLLIQMMSRKLLVYTCIL